MRITQLFSLLLIASLTHATDSDPFSYEVITVAPNVYAFAEPEMRGIVSGTVIAVVGEQSVLVFDTTHRVTSAQRIIADLKRLTKKPVRYIVNSHWHEDHWTGNGEFAAAFPMATFFSHTFTAEIIHKRRETFRGEHCKKEIHDGIAPVELELKAKKRADSTSLSQAGIAFREQMVLQGRTQIAECDRMRYRGSDVTFDSRLSIDLGGRQVELMHLGRANTAGDVLAYLPKEKILLTGDVVVAPFPFATQSYIREWADVLDKILAMDVDVIVPGHGPVMRDKTYVQNMATLMRGVSQQVHKIYEPGMSADDVRKQIDIKSIRDTFVGNDNFVAANFDYMILELAVNRAVEEESGAFKPEGEPIP